MTNSTKVRRPARTSPPGAGEEVPLRVASALRELRRALQAASFKTATYGRGVDLGQVDVLDLLVSRDGWRGNDLAAALRIDPSTLTRAVNRLVTAGLASRAAVEADGRGVEVSATEAGRRFHRRISKGRAELMRHLLADFTVPEQETFVSLLERFIDAIDLEAERRSIEGSDRRTVEEPSPT